MKHSRFVVLAFMCCILAGCGAASKGTSEIQAAPSNTDGSGSPPPTPIAVLDTFPISGWQTCGTCGNTGGSGNGASANYSVADATTPSLD